MKAGKLVAIFVGVLASAACAAPWYNGTRVENSMREYIEQGNADKHTPFAMTTVSFQHGWLSSEAVTRISLKADPNIHFDVHHHIAQLPDRMGWVRVHSVPQWTGEAKAALDYYFGGQPALAIDTLVSYDGNHISEIYSPAFNKPLHQHPEATVSWGGMRGTFTVDGESHWQGSLNAPSLGVEGAGHQVSVDGIKLQMKWDTHGPAMDWQGETKIGMDELRYAETLHQVTVKDIAGGFSQRSAGNEVQFGYMLRVGSVSSMKAGEANQQFNNAVLDLELAKLNKAALAKYSDDFNNAQKLSMTPEARGRLATQLVMKLGMELLHGSPELRLKNLAVETPSGAIVVHASVTFDGNGLPDSPMPADLMARLKAKADVKVAGTLLRAQLQQHMRPQIEVAVRQQGALSNEENIRLMSDKMIDDQLKNWTDAGLLKTAGQDYTVDAQFAMGQALVNGVPVNQLFAGMLGAPAAPAQPQPNLMLPGQDGKAPGDSAALSHSGAMASATAK
jgi:uncharacterized protein YdgA (DUF945 family)